MEFSSFPFNLDISKILENIFWVKSVFMGIDQFPLE